MYLFWATESLLSKGEGPGRTSSEPGTQAAETVQGVRQLLTHAAEV